MKKGYTSFFVMVFVLILSFSSTYSQTQRNPVLEYCTGTWCQWCPCGHAIIRDQILVSYPNAIILGYHGPTNYGDPYAGFPGYTIMSSLGLSSYPTGIVDRVSGVISRSSWYPNIATRNNVPAKVDINIIKTFDSTNNQLQGTVYFNALENLTGSYKYYLTILEDNLMYAQTGNSSCTGGTEYRHNHVVRNILNGATGDTITNLDWSAGQIISRPFAYTVTNITNFSNCHMAIVVYKVGASLVSSEIQQAKQWTLSGEVLPVELVTFMGNVNSEGIELQWKTATEVNNHGFEIQRSLDGKNFITVGFEKGFGTTTDYRQYNYFDKLSFNERVTVYYRLKQIDFSGEYSYSDVIAINYDMPKEFALMQNYPNPFNPSTVIKYTIAKNSNVSLKIYDLLGNEVTTLVNETKTPGTYQLEFDASNLSSGTYFYKLVTDYFVSVKKMAVIK